MMKKKSSGYSLVEVLIAMAITSIVLLTVVTLFYMGKRNVYSGKQMSYAVSVGTRILEDLSSLTSDDLLSNFTITDSTTLGNVTVQGVTYANSFARDTSTCTAAATPPPAFTCTGDASPYFLSAWKGLIDPTKLQNAKVGLIFTPTNPADTTTPAPWTSARFIKIRAYIQWDEAQRRRIAYFDTTKVNRQ
jgi:prepilin-type N-terminal cleavage/methylation domain-containing protein